MFRKIKNTFNSLSVRLILAVSPIVVLAFVWITTNFVQLSSDVVLSMVAKNLKRDTNSIMRLVDNEFSSRYSDIETITSNPLIIKSLKKRSFTQVGKTFYKYKKNYKVYSAIELYDAQGNIQASSSKSMLKFLKRSSEGDQSRSSWFGRAMRGVIGHTKLEKSSIFSSFVIHFYSPIKDSRTQKILGVVRLVYSWKHIYKRIRHYEVYSDDDLIRSFFLVDGKTQKLLYHTNKDQINQDIESVNLNLSQALKSGVEPEHEKYIIRVNYEVSNYFENNLGWVCIGIEDKKVALSFLNDLKKSFQATSLTTIFVLMIVLILIVRFLTTPIIKLASSMKSIVSSKRFGEQLKMGGISEINHLVNAFNQMSKGLKESDGKVRELAILAELNPGPVFRVAKDGEILLFNAAASTIFNIDPKNSSMGLDKVFPEINFEDLRQLEHKDDDLNIEIFKNSNYYNLNCFYSDELESFFIFGADITERKHSYIQSMHAVKLASIGELAAGVAHEINNPLSVTTGHTMRMRETLKQAGVDNSEIETSLDKQEIANSRIRDIVDGLRLFARQDGDDLTESCSLTDLMDQTHGLLGKIYEKQGIQLICNLPSSDYTIKGSTGKHQQVLMNLISNAKDATEGQAIRRIELGVEEKDSEKVVLFVKDNGGGIPDEIQEKIFESFFSTKEAGKGTGMGLGICQKLLDEIGGKMTLESKMGWGTCFRVELPICESGGEMVSDNEKKKEEQKKMEGKVLVVDDEEDIREILEWLLSRMGFDVELAQDAEEGLEKIKQEDFDFVFTDLTMPKMSGFEFIQMAREIPDKHSKYFIISGNALDFGGEDRPEVSIDGYVSKPFSEESLYRTIKPHFFNSEAA